MPTELMERRSQIAPNFDFEDEIEQSRPSESSGQTPLSRFLVSSSANDPYSHYTSSTAALWGLVGASEGQMELADMRLHIGENGADLVTAERKVQFMAATRMMIWCVTDETLTKRLEQRFAGRDGRNIDVISTSSSMDGQVDYNNEDENDDTYENEVDSENDGEDEENDEDDEEGEEGEDGEDGEEDDEDAAEDEEDEEVEELEDEGDEIKERRRR
jgi:hypothetical protein